MIAFFVSGTPVPQPRPQITTRGSFAQAYVPARHPIHTWRHQVALAGKNAVQAKLEGPLSLRLMLYMPRPKSHYGTGRNAGNVKRSAPAFPAVRPDIDNLAKGVQDALDGVIWADDAQVVHLDCRKLYASAPQEPGCLVRVREVEETAA